MSRQTLKKYSHLGQHGFAMPTVIFLMVIMAFVAYAALLQANNGLNLAYKQMYIQMARTASKAAVDYAQEQFDNTTCGNYTGTAEQTLVTNNRYKVTFKVDIVSTSADGYEKTVKGTGSVYLPKNATTARYVFDIRSEIVRTYAVCKTPDNYNPTLWLDASDTSTLKHSSTSSTSVSATTDFGSSSDSSRATLEERADNGSQTTASWQSPDLEMHTCSSSEFSSSICSSNSTKYLNDGIIFQNINVPQGSVVSSASLQLTGGNPSGTGGSLTQRVYGIFKSSSDPHPDLFTSTGSNQLRTPLNTANLHTTSYKDFTTNNFPPGNTVNVDVTSIVQEVLNKSGWDSADGKLGFGIQRVSGSGSRNACKGGSGGSGCTASDEPKLTISFASSTVSQANNTETVTEWDDKSANQYNAISTHGNAPTRVDNQINGKTVVRFNNGDMLSTLSTALSGKREMTVFAVMKANYGTSSTDGRVVSGMTSSASNDTSGTNAIIPLLRNGSSTGFSSVYASLSSNYRTDFLCSSSCSSNPYSYTSVFTNQDSNHTTAALKGNGAPGTTKTGISPSGNNAYTYGINQLYIAGTRSGAMPGSGTNYFNGDYGELIVYDHALTCPQIEAIEEYLRAKWNTVSNQVTTTCTGDDIPTLQCAKQRTI